MAAQQDESMERENQPLKESLATDNVANTATFNSPAKFFENNAAAGLNEEEGFSLSSSQPSSQGILKKGRKSIGRRVSFATTAHVRVFDKSKGQENNARPANDEADDNEQEERNLQSFRQQFEQQPQPHAEESAQIDGLKENFSGFDIKSSPISLANTEAVNSANSPLKRSFSEISNQSFDVDLKVEEQLSFSSYLSPEKDMMDLTGCVGNILDELSSPLGKQNNSMSFDEDSLNVNNQMEFTKCVGSILAQMTTATTTNNNGNTAMASDMDMTQTVGGLVQESVPVTSDAPVASDFNETISGSSHSNLGSNVSAEPADMELTQTIGNPFDAAKSEQPVDVSFIEETAAPKGFSQQSPTKSGTGSAPKETSIMTMMEISEKVDQESIAIASAAIEARNRESSIAADMFKVFSVEVEQLNASAANYTSSNATASLFLSSDAGPTAAKANLKEFLNETGVRFLDNLSNMGRRETVGRPRDSAIMTPARKMYVQSVLIPETAAVERACVESVRTIDAQRKFLHEEEAKFSHHPPLAFREFAQLPAGEGPERAQLLQKLKTLKSVARLFARQSWYEWRRGFESGFYSELERVLTALKLEYSQLEQERAIISASGSEVLDAALTDLQSTLQQLRSRYESLSRCDWQQAMHLHAQVQEKRARVTALDAEMREIAHQESELRARVEGALEARKSAQERILALKHSVSQFEDCTELALSELKSTFALQEALNGWKLIQLRADSLTCEYTRGTANAPILIRMNYSPEDLKVNSMLIESESAALATLRPAHLLLNPLFKTLPEAVTGVMLQLDRLVQLSRDLSLIKVQCDVQILPVTKREESSMEAESVSGSDASNILPLLLTFFNFSAKIKFDVILGVSLSPLAPHSLNLHFLSFASHYGPVTELAVRTAVEEAMFSSGRSESSSTDSTSLRIIISAISNLSK